MARKLLVLATPIALGAGGWAIFYVIKEPPRVEGCFEGTAPGVEAYREGLGAYATFAAAVIGALIARTSPTKRTTHALAACAWLVLLYNVENDTFAAHAVVALVLAILGGELLLASSAIATLVVRRSRAAQLTYLWTAMLVFLPALTGYTASEGVPWLCLD